METQRGVYVALRVLGAANACLDTFMAENNIPIVGTEKEPRRHVTVIYSRTYAAVEPVRTKLYQAYGAGFELFHTQDGKNCLVLLLDAPAVAKRHEELMQQHSLTYDFPEYRPHITLSYDAGDLDVASLKFPDFCCVLGDEYVEDLDLGWEK